MLARSLMMALVLASSPPQAIAGPKLPSTPRRPVEDVYQGATIRDDYRWLEDSKEATVTAWSDSQNAVTRAFLDAIPDRAAILERVTFLTHNNASYYYGLRYANGVWFALKDQPPRQQPLLVRLHSVDDTTSDVIADPNLLDPSGKTSIDFFVPSLDGSKVAVSLSTSGTEDGTVSVFETATGRRLPDQVQRVNGGTAGGDVTWNADGSGFWRTRYPSPGERSDADLHFYQQIYFHRLGTPATEDAYVVGREFPRIAEIELQSTDDGRYVLADVFNGDGGEHAFWLAGPEGRFVQVTTFADRAVKASLGPDALFLLSRQDAPNGKILRIPLGEALNSGALGRATVLVPESPTAIATLVAGRTRLFVQDIVGGPSQLRIVDAATGRSRGQVPLGPVSSVSGLIHTSDDQLLLQIQSFTEPGRWWRVDPRHPEPVGTALRLRSPADYSDTEVRREFAVSRDGTRIPLNILIRKGTRLDGNTPCLLTGYGGYGMSQSPSFSTSRRLWLEQGGMVAVANLRGGGEYGEAWHVAGSLTKKQNVFDDFAACAAYLIERKYTRTDRLAIQGGSNGGLLMGAMMTQHPERFRAIVSSVGIYDMLRVESTPNGEFNITEFGTVKDPEQFAALRAYSPYHRVKDGTHYPATLMLTGANDPRVEPWQSRKMIARLQTATGGDAPILLRTSGSTGHGGGTPRDARNQQLADIYAFLFKVLGMTYRTPTAGALP